MRVMELTDEEVETLTQALADPSNTAAQHLLQRANASSIDGVLDAIVVARGVERSLLLAIARQAILRSAS